MDSDSMDIWKNTNMVDAEEKLNLAARGVGTDDGGGAGEEAFGYEDGTSMEQLTGLMRRLHHESGGVAGGRSLAAAKLARDTSLGEGSSTIVNDAHGDLSTMMETPIHRVERRARGEVDLELLHRLTAAPDRGWMRFFRSVLDASTDDLPSEMIHCPVCILLVASTSDENYVRAFRELTSVHHLPKSYGMGQFDPGDVSEGHGGAKRFLVLLHDESGKEGGIDEAGVLRELRAEFPQHEAVVLRLNSYRPPYGDVVDTAGPLQRGRHLSREDVTRLRSFIANNLVKDGIIPTMERRIFHLNAVVSNAKKGVKNMIKGLWRKPKESGGGSMHGGGSGSLHGYDSQGGSAGRAGSGGEDMSGGMVDSAFNVRYGFDSIESQTRLLADSLFLMKDYETALSFYRLVKDDYKADKALVYYASIQEMIALCLYLLDGSGTMSMDVGSSSSTASIMMSNGVGFSRYGREIHGAVENALYSYTRAADEERFYVTQRGDGGPDQSKAAQSSRPQQALLATRLATRLCMVVSSFSQGGILSPSRHLEIADLLASASSHETPMGAAVLLEQASGHYLKSSLIRKYGFHMLMSGHMYRSCKQERHGMRCFTAALHVYEVAKWKELFDHLQSALAQQLYSLPNKERPQTPYISMAVQFYCRLVGSGTGRISARSQHKFLQHFMEICRTLPYHALEAATQMRRVDSGGVGGDVIGNGDDWIEKSQAVDGVTVQEVLEIPNMDLPRIIDSTVIVHSASALDAQMEGASENGGGFGDVSSSENPVTTVSDYPTPSGLSAESESVWDELASSMEAELRASLPPSSDEVKGPIDSIERVVEEMDRVERSKPQTKKSKASSHSTKNTIADRARMEPFVVSVTMANPLGIPLQLTEVQLVAVLKSCQNDKTKGRICTNERVMLLEKQPGDISSAANEQLWSFASSERKFEKPSFVRTYTQEEGCDISAPDDEKLKGAGINTDEIYFVVDKQSILMEAGSVRIASLSVCPLVQGDLSVVGLRCKLFNEVWIYHKFNLKGPLLQDTRVNRANRVRGRNVLLKSRVREDMPLLSIDIQNVKPSALQGEVSRWTLRMTNIGSAAACNILLKTNLPWICLERGAVRPANIQYKDEHQSGAKDVNRNEDEVATGCCVGPSGTLIQLPLSSCEGKEPALHPGESLDIPVRVRAGGGGKQELHMLFRYDLFTKNDKTSSGSKGHQGTSSEHRLLKKLVTVSVYPSLTFAASLMPSYWHKREHVLSIELTNYRSDRQPKLAVDLAKICVASRFFRVVQVGGQLEDAGVGVGVGDDLLAGMEIGWQERITLHFIVIPLEVTRYTLTECSVSRDSSDARLSSNGPLTDFACIENAHGKLKAAVDAHEEEMTRRAALNEDDQQQPRSIAQIRRQNSQFPGNTSNPALKQSEQVRAPDADSDTLLVSGVSGSPYPHHPTSIANLCPVQEANSTINVICVWKATSCNGQFVFGQHHLLQLPVRPRTKSQGCPLTITAKHKTSISHSFAAGPLEMDLEITVRNRLVATRDENVPRTDSTDDNGVEFEFAVTSQPEFEFIGAECFDWRLNGGEELVVPMKALFTTSGIFNLQSVQLTIYGGKEKTERIPYLFPLQWILKVDDLEAAYALLASFGLFNRNRVAVMIKRCNHIWWS